LSSYAWRVDEQFLGASADVRFVEQLKLPNSNQQPYRSGFDALVIIADGLRWATGQVLQVGVG
jgi:hypothetical protein